jgi:GT2 family glycosyltransferase
MTDHPIRFVAGSSPVDATDHDADVILLTLQRTEESLAAIASALAQVGVSRHLFVLDQGSTPAALDRLAAAVAGRRDASLYRSERNLGVGGGRNALSALGRGRVIAALDNDAEFADARTLAGMVAALDADAGLAAIGCRIVSHATGRDDLSSWGYPSRLLARAGERFDAVTFVGAGHAIRRTAWQAAGGYDPALFFCWEEYDFCLRAIALGWRVGYCGDLVVRHKVSAEQRLGWSEQRWRRFVRNRLHIERKCGSGWPALLPRIGGYLVKGTRHGLLAATLSGIAEAAAMPLPPSRAPLSPEARTYLRRHDRDHRGGLWQRWRTDVLGRLPSQA